jgi:glycosyltransferase involved in cell wall biosynthesis
MAAMGRIAIAHYTAAPDVGGVENLVDAQIDALHELGRSIRLIVGSGDADPRGELALIPELHPAHPQVMSALGGLNGTIPPPEHPLVRCIGDHLRSALQDCEQCWVHNAFTVYLNPFLTVALGQLTRDMPEVEWIAWCHDLSASSAYWPPLTAHERQRAQMIHPGVRYVTISRFRRAELSRLLAVAEGEIAVIPPPLDVRAWLDISSQTREIVQRLDLPAAEPVILVPAKLLPHKNLELAIRVASSLRELTERPALLITAADSPHQPQESARIRRSLQDLVYEEGVESVVHFLPDLLGGVPSTRTVRDLMLLSDLVLLLSAEEGFGTPIREAASLRTPVLCSSLPAFREAGGGHARYFELGDTADSIAARVLEIAQVPANVARRAAARSWRQFCSQLEALLTT